MVIGERMRQMGEGGEVRKSEIGKTRIGERMRDMREGRRC